MLSELFSLLRCCLGLHEWRPWLPANDDYKRRRFCARCPKMQVTAERQAKGEQR